MTPHFHVLYNARAFPNGRAIRQHRRRLRTVAVSKAKSGEHTSNPQTPKREPFATHSGKKADSFWMPESRPIFHLQTIVSLNVRIVGMVRDLLERTLHATTAAGPRTNIYQPVFLPLHRLKFETWAAMCGRVSEANNHTQGTWKPTTCTEIREDTKLKVKPAINSASFGTQPCASLIGET